MAPKPKNTVVVEFTKHSETKGTWRFSEDNEDNPVVGTLYVKKAHVEALGNPENLTVTIVGS